MKFFVGMEAVEAGMVSVVTVGDPLAEGVGEMVADLGGSLVDVFVFCHVNIVRWHTVVKIFPTISPLLLLLRLRLSFL